MYSLAVTLVDPTVLVVLLYSSPIRRSVPPSIRVFVERMWTVAGSLRIRTTYGGVAPVPLPLSFTAYVPAARLRMISSAPLPARSEVWSRVEQPL